jgi:hypothetical protein
VADETTGPVIWLVLHDGECVGTVIATTEAEALVLAREEFSTGIVNVAVPTMNNETLFA